MQKGLVSVVIPIYKTEKYLNQCIESVVNQSYTNLEILLIDDGSPDNCPQMCDTWAMRDTRIKVIHKVNAGLGMARNTGIDNATGEYICFFDSDDYIDPNTIKHAYEACKKEQAEVCVFGHVDVDPEGKLISQFIPSLPKNVYKGQAVQNDFLPDLIGPDGISEKKTNLCMSACMMLCSTETIKSASWYFVSEREVISEDMYSLLGLFRYINSVVVLQEALYFYRRNNNSLTHVYRADRYEKVKFFYEKCLLRCKECEYSQEVADRCAELFISFTISLLKQETAFFPKREDAIARIQGIILDEALQPALAMRRKEKIRITRRLLCWAMRTKCYALCYMLLKAKNQLEGN